MSNSASRARALGRGSALAAARTAALLLAFLCALPLEAQSQQLDVTLVNAISRAPLAGVDVVALERLVDGTDSPVELGTTDSAGRVDFQLAGLGEGRAYLLWAQPYNASLTRSPLIDTPGAFTFEAGALEVRVVKGSDGMAFAGVDVYVGAVAANGQVDWRALVTTDAEGLLQLDPNWLADGEGVALAALSPADGSFKRRAVITTAGAFSFVVGGPALNISVRNAVSGEPLADQLVYVLERLPGGTTDVRRAQRTDPAGRLVVDLDGLGQGSSFVLRTEPYNTGPVDSADITAPGDFAFAVGQLEVAVLRGTDRAPMAMATVYVGRPGSSGIIDWQTAFSTDESGRLRFDPPWFAPGEALVLAAASVVDGSIKTSGNITNPGLHSFVVGGPALEVTVVDAVYGTPFTDLEVVAMERLATGELLPSRVGRTDVNGRVRFDLEGLGPQRQYSMWTSPYADGSVSSEPFDAPGQVRFEVGALDISVSSGADGGALADRTILVGEREASGEVVWRSSSQTDSAGKLRLDPPWLGTGTSVVLGAESPIDASFKQSGDITATGAYDFVVGGPGLQVTVVNGISGAPVAGVDVVVNERLANGQVRLERYLTTDTSGALTLDLDGLGDGRRYFMQAAPYASGVVDSADITAPGPFSFVVGTTELAVVDRTSGNPLAGHWVLIGEQSGDGAVVFHSAVQTDSQGLARLDVPWFAAGNALVFAIESPFDGTMKLSDPVHEPGRVTFPVGGGEVEVTVHDGLDGRPLANLEVAVLELLADGTEVETRRETTDANGRFRADLDGLADGRRYRLQATAFNGGEARSSTLDRAGEFEFRVGRLSVALLDAANDAPIVDQTLIILRKTANGLLLADRLGSTDAAGRVRFDPDGLGAGSVFVVTTENPFGQNQQFFGPVITVPGAVEMRISQGAPDDIDLTPPSLTLVSPSDGGAVARSGFRVAGYASDDEGAPSVTLTVIDPVAGRSGVAVARDAQSGAWSADIAADRLTPGHVIGLEVQARDEALNSATRVLQLTVIDDSLPPTVIIESHEDGAEVPDSGFLLSGRMTDDTTIASLFASIEDPGAGRVMARRAVDLAPDSARWTLAVDGAGLHDGRTIEVLLEARDTHGNVATSNLSLHVSTRDYRARKLIDRITFGVTPALLAEVKRLGPAAFLAQQLAPDAIADDALDARLSNEAPRTNAELWAYPVTRAVYSRRQLREVMTWFWENHFNTYLTPQASLAYEFNENRAFRTHSLGRFRTLLGLSSKSPAMLEYLDGRSNTREAPNENYARELLELHTIGIDGGFDQSDVENVARAFTGWTLLDGVVAFLPDAHDSGEKLVLSTVLPSGGGVEDGEQVLDLLAAHPATARHLCTKLTHVFVTDTPSQATIDDCADVFLARRNAADQIGQVVEHLLTSAEFDAPATYRSKIKTPFELIAGLARVFDAEGCCEELPPFMGRQGMWLFQRPSPRGYPERGDSWLNSGSMLAQVKYLDALISSDGTGSNTHVNLVEFFRDQGYETAEGIAGHLLMLAFDDDLTPLERQTALSTLPGSGPFPFWLGAPDARSRLQMLVRVVLSFPKYRYQ